MSTTAKTLSLAGFAALAGRVTASAYQPHYTPTTLDLTWASSEHRWREPTIVQNLEDKNIISFGIRSTEYTQVQLAPPRTYGASIKVRLH